MRPRKNRRKRANKPRQGRLVRAIGGRGRPPLRSFRECSESLAEHSIECSAIFCCADRFLCRCSLIAQINESGEHVFLYVSHGWVCRSFGRGGGQLVTKF